MDPERLLLVLSFSTRAHRNIVMLFIGLQWLLTRLGTHERVLFALIMKLLTLVASDDRNRLPFVVKWLKDEHFLIPELGMLAFDLVSITICSRLVGLRGLFADRPS